VYVEVGGQLHTPVALSSGKEPRYVWIGGSVGYRVASNVEERRRIIFIRLESNPDSTVLEPAA
jgi:hypothetical protein